MNLRFSLLLKTSCSLLTVASPVSESKGAVWLGEATPMPAAPAPLLPFPSSAGLEAELQVLLKAGGSGNKGDKGLEAQMVTQSTGRSQGTHHHHQCFQHQRSGTVLRQHVLCLLNLRGLALLLKSQFPLIFTRKSMSGESGGVSQSWKC